MSDEEYIVRREVDEEEEFEDGARPAADETVFDNEFRILVLANSSMSVAKQGDGDSAAVSVEESDMEELLVRQVRTLDDVNEFFDEFDSTVAVPNEGHLKYEVGSDGLCVVLVDSVSLKDAVVQFVQQYMEKHGGDGDGDGDAVADKNDQDHDKDAGEPAAKRRR